MTLGMSIHIPALVDIGKTGSPKSPTHIGWGNGTGLCGAVFAESEARTVDADTLLDQELLYPVSLRQNLCRTDVRLLRERVRKRAEVEL
ncbi:MAG: hypothetical protein JRM77_02290 [Nitrososphaerota archaeon]|nr:hypothetical protein [Nitrososphaerota archaeon]